MTIIYNQTHFKKHQSLKQNIYCMILLYANQGSQLHFMRFHAKTKNIPLPCGAFQIWSWQVYTMKEHRSSKRLIRSRAHSTDMHREPYKLMHMMMPTSFFTNKKSSFSCLNNSPPPCPSFCVLIIFSIVMAIDNTLIQNKDH